MCLWLHCGALRCTAFVGMGCPWPFGEATPQRLPASHRCSPPTALYCTASRHTAPHHTKIPTHPIPPSRQA